MKKKTLTQLEPVTAKAVSVYRYPGRLLSEAVELEIVNGVVISVKKLTRAEDSFNTSISRATKRLWEVIRDQSKNAFFGIED